MDNIELTDTLEMVDKKPIDRTLNQPGFSNNERQQAGRDPALALHSELHGKQVLINPSLDNDPAAQQGKAGFIAYARTFDEIYVGFENGKEGVYSLDDVMQLNDRSEIFPDDKSLIAKLDTKDYKDLFTIARLQDMGRSTDIKKALEIAGNNPAIRDRTLSPVSESMARKNEYTIGR